MNRGTQRPFGFPFLLLFLFALAAPAGCGDEGEDAAAGAGDDWQVERTTTEEGHTLVRNLAGSEWGGDAIAREELSIGVLEGDEAYMLSRPSGIHLTDDEIFVLDSQDNRVRVYDHEGVFLREFGQEGQGPGEFQNPMAIASDGERLFVGGGMSNGRIAVFDMSGEHIEDWSLGSFNPAFRLWVVEDDIYTIRFERPEPGETNFMDRRQMFQRVGPDGLEGEPIEIPNLGTGESFTVSFMGREMEMPIPGGPTGTISAMALDGRYVVGFPDDYRFEIRDPATGERTIVERYWDPVPISEAEIQESLDRMLGSLRQQVPDITVGDIDFPEYRTAYVSFQVHRDGRIWLYRQGEATRIEGCEPPETFSPGVAPEQCWEHETFIDLFDLEGDFLGSVAKIDGETFFAQDVHGDLVATVEPDEFDTPMVKIYRLELPPGDTDS